MSSNFAGARVLVTGGTRGIGRGIAHAFEQAGATVFVCGRKPPEESLGALRFLQADIRDADQVTAMMERLVGEAGGIDVVVNNAGGSPPADAATASARFSAAIIALNLTAAFHTIRLALPGMKAKGWGRIINTASAHSLVASPNKAAYVAAKHGIAGLTKTVALEVAREGITVNAISPGYVWTPLVENQIPDTMKARGLTREQVMNDVLLAAQPTKQFVTVEQVASMALYLASDAASGMTGSNVSMDGGWTAQ